MFFLPTSDSTSIRTSPGLTIAIFIACIAIYVLQFLIGEEQAQYVFYDFALIPHDFMNPEEAEQGIFHVPEWATLFTSALLHGDPAHLVGNMIFFWIFADNIEHAFGRFRYVLFILGAAALCSAASLFVRFDDPIPVIGLSGVVAAIMGAYFVLYPRARVAGILFLPIPVNMEIRALWFLGAWFAFEIWSAAAGETYGVAFEAHIIGFVVGMIFGRLLRQNYCSYDYIHGVAAED